MPDSARGPGQDKKNEALILTNRIDRISIGILSGGESTRMGCDKALVKIENERFIDRLTGELKGFDEIIISAAKRSIYDDMGFRVVYDENSKIGPIEGIRKVLEASENELVFICAADMPFIKKELVSYIAGYISSDYDCYVIADEDHVQPLCAIYSKAALPVIEELISQGSYRLRKVLDRMRTKYITLEHSCFDKKVVRNINTRQELRDLRKPCVFCVSGFSNSGKTWLTQKLINEFINNGLSVGAIKHDGHDRIGDAPGSDTMSYRDAGAVYTSIFSDSAYLSYVKECVTPDFLIDEMRGRKSPPDVIIIEGLKDSSFPKIEVVRGRVYDKCVCDESTRICIVTDCISPREVSCPVFGFEDVRGIFLCLKEYFEL